MSIKRLALFVFAFASVCVLAIQPALAHGETVTPSFTITANADGISIPDQFPAGMVAVTFQNDNEDKSFALELGRLNEDATVEQFSEALGSGDIPTALQLVTLMGGTEVAPASSFTMIFDFQPGTHFLLDSDAGTVAGTFTVAESEAQPEADIEVSLMDWVFGGVPNEIEAGMQRWTLTNEGEEWHEMSIATVDEGTTVEDVLAAGAAFAAGEAPEINIEEIFISAAMSPGQSVSFDLDLEPGTYAVICLLPSTADGMPHALHGMVQIVTVTEAA